MCIAELCNHAQSSSSPHVSTGYQPKLHIKLKLQHPPDNKDARSLTPLNCGSAGRTETITDMHQAWNVLEVHGHRHDNLPVYGRFFSKTREGSEQQLLWNAGLHQ